MSHGHHHCLGFRQLVPGHELQSVLIAPFLRIGYRIVDEHLDSVAFQFVDHIDDVRVTQVGNVCLERQSENVDLGILDRITDVDHLLDGLLDNELSHVVEQTIKQMIHIGNPVKDAKVNVLGLTFKADVPDLRNSHVIDVINELKSYGVQVFVHDPVPDPEEARNEYGLELVSWDELPKAEAMVVAVAHRQFRSVGAEAFARKIVKGGCFIDVKSQFDREALSAAGLCVWRL